MISWDMISDRGKRSHNEDMIGCKQKGEAACFVLADGLGGHGKGEVASQLVVETILDTFESAYEKESFLETALAKAQEVLCCKQQEMHCISEMKTTVVVLVVERDYLQWGFCGDSRLYYFVRRRLKSRTIDHSVPQLLVLSGQLKEKKIRFHEDRNRLLRVLGIQSEKKLYEIMPKVSRKGNEQFLLCSDGFWEYILEKDMQKLLKRAMTPAQWLAHMKEIVLQNGEAENMDNFSAIAVWIEKE